MIVSGKTYTMKDTLKAKGARWSPRHTAWIFPGSDVDSIRSSLQPEIDARMAEQKREKAAKRAHKLWLATPEGMAHTAEQEKEKVRWALGQKASGNYSYHWICCEECEVVDWGRKTTYCLAHAEGGNSFRICGGLYTGD